MVDLGKKILKAIEDTYKVCYVGFIRIVKLVPEGYLINLGLNDSKENLISTSIGINDKELVLKYFIKDLRERFLHHSQFLTEVRSNSNPGIYYRIKPLIEYKEEPVNIDLDCSEVILNVYGDKVTITVKANGEWKILLTIK